MKIKGHQIVEDEFSTRYDYHEQLRRQRRDSDTLESSAKKKDVRQHPKDMRRR
jgi:hypothetical protein